MFDWRTLGKADYSQAHAIVASLPEAIRRQLPRGGHEILCRITFLCWSFAQRSGRGKAYAIPSERYLAESIGRSERTVRRILTALRSSGLLTWVRRLGPGRTWMTNLYQLGRSFLASLFARRGKKPQQNHQRPFLADNDLKREYKGGESDEDAAFWERMRQKKRDMLDAFLQGKASAYA